MRVPFSYSLIFLFEVICFSSRTSRLNKLFGVWILNKKKSDVWNRLTWTAQFKKQLFWPGPLSKPFVDTIDDRSNCVVAANCDRV